MSSIVVAGDSSGSITIAAPSVAGSGTLTLPVATDTLVGKATTDTLTNKSIAATQLTGTIAAAALPAGSVLQVVQTVKTSTFTSSVNNTWTDITGMSVSITPASSSNKILILTSISTGGGGNNYARGFRFVRGATAINIADAGTGTSASGGVFASYDQGLITICMNFLDSPAATSSTTYKIQFLNPTPSATGIAINQPYSPDASSFLGTSTITVMEIKG
jgi:hypothetical protein